MIMTEKKTAKKVAKKETAKTEKTTSVNLEKAARQQSKKPVKTKAEKSAWDILIYPHLAEKSMNKVDMENKIVFVVHPDSNKSEIKKAVEDMFKVKVSKVTTEITRFGEKKAHIKLDQNYSAADIASRLGVM